MPSVRAPGFSTVTVTAKQRVPSVVMRSTFWMSVTTPSKFCIRSATDTPAVIPAYTWSS